MNFARFYEKKNDTWNIRRLVEESFVPSTQLISILYCRLTDFKFLGRIGYNDISFYNFCTRRILLEFCISLKVRVNEFGFRLFD